MRKSRLRARKKDLDAGNFATALPTATTIQSQLADREKVIADAVAALKK